MRLSVMWSNLAADEFQSEPASGDEEEFDNDYLRSIMALNGPFFCSPKPKPRFIGSGFDMAYRHFPVAFKSLPTT